MPIRFIPNDPLAGSTAPPAVVKTKRPDRPATKASYTMPAAPPEGPHQPGTPGFVFWQCREAAMAAVEAWEGFAGAFTAWQGNRKKMALRHDVDVDLNAFYDRASFSFFHRTIGSKTFFSGASADVVAHEVGHGLLDAIRPQLWDAPYLEAGAFHEAFGDCVAILTALDDLATRKALLAVAPNLGKRNFVESTAEELSDGIRRLVPGHNAAAPRRAFNTFQFQIPDTLPDDGGPGKLINEVHSFGMLFSGCFYDLISGLFTAKATQDEAALLAASRTAGALLVAGARTALIRPRFFQAVGRAMELADDQANGGANRQVIRDAFQKHGIMLGANALLAPTATLAGKAPRLGRAAAIGPATRKDLAERLQAAPGTRLTVEGTTLSGMPVARVVHKQTVALGKLDERLKGVTVAAEVPVLVGRSGGRAAVMGAVPEPVSTENEVNAFVRSLLAHGQVEMAAKAAGAAKPKGMVAVASKEKRAAGVSGKAVPRETHRVATVGGKKVLVRVRFHCGVRSGRGR